MAALGTIRAKVAYCRNDLVPAVLLLGVQTAVGDMSDLFLWRIREKAYTKRAEECRQLAKICPEHLRQGYLDLAAEYEQLAKKSPQIAQRARHDKED